MCVCPVFWICCTKMNVSLLLLFANICSLNLNLNAQPVCPIYLKWHVDSLTDIYATFLVIIYCWFWGESVLYLGVYCSKAYFYIGNKL
jgi:hypothetical protein